MNFIKRSLQQYLQYWIVILLGLLGLGFLALSGYLALQQLVPATLAALIVGAVTLLIAVLFYLLQMRRPSTDAPPAAEEQPEALKESAVQLAQHYAGRIPAEIERRPEVAMAVALGVGIVLGVSPQARSLLGSTLKLGAKLAEEELNRRS